MKLFNQISDKFFPLFIAVKKSLDTWTLFVPATLVRIDYFFHSWLTTHNNTPQKTSEAMLKESEERHRLLFENNPLPMWIYDQQTLAFLAVNDAAIATYGYSREEFLQMTIADIRPADEVPNLKGHHRNRQSALIYSEGWHHSLKNGTIIDVDISSHRFENIMGLQILVVAQDVTRRKQAETVLRDGVFIFPYMMPWYKTG